MVVVRLIRGGIWLLLGRQSESQATAVVCQLSFLDTDNRGTGRAFVGIGLMTSPDIFVFCLSTRAGGLGINLTAADTVIFCKSAFSSTGLPKILWDRLCHNS